jgi:hypothetical protein
MRGRSKKEAGYEEFVVDGWNSWNNPSRLKDHVGGVGGPHNEAQKNCDALLKREQHIDIALHKYTSRVKFLEMLILFDSMVQLKLLDGY